MYRLVTRHTASPNQISQYKSRGAHSSVVERVNGDQSGHVPKPLPQRVIFEGTSERTEGVVG